MEQTQMYYFRCMKNLGILILILSFAACQTSNEQHEEEDSTFNVVGNWQNTLDFSNADTSNQMIKELISIQDSTTSYLEFKSDHSGVATLTSGSNSEQINPFSWEQVGDTIRTQIQNRSFDYLILDQDHMEVIILMKDPFGVRGKLIRIKSEE